MSQENKQEKRKKDVVMSLDEFNMHYTPARTIDSEKPEKLPSVTKFDDFSYWQDVPAFDLKEASENFGMSPGLLINMLFWPGLKVRLIKFIWSKAEID